MLKNTTTNTASANWWLLTIAVLLTFLANFPPILALPTTSLPPMEKGQAPNQMYIN